MASGGHSALEVHLTVAVLWLTQTLAVVLFSTPTFGSSATGNKEEPMLWTCWAKICCITQKPIRKVSYRLRFRGFLNGLDLFRGGVKPF